MIRSLLLFCALLWPVASDAVVHVRVSTTPRHWAYSWQPGPLTTQHWTVVPTRPLAPDAIATTDSVFINRLGQAWRVIPLPSGPDSVTTVDPAMSAKYEHPDPDFSGSVLQNPRYTVTRRFFNIEVSSYNSEQRQTDSTPWEIRNNFLVRFGDAACNFLPRGTLFRLPNAPAPFNTVVFRVEDQTSPKYGHRIDLWLLRVQHAENWGIKHLTVEVLGPPRGEAPQ